MGDPSPKHATTELNVSQTQEYVKRGFKGLNKDTERALNKLRAKSKSKAIKWIESDANNALFILDVMIKRHNILWRSFYGLTAYDSSSISILAPEVFPDKK